MTKGIVHAAPQYVGHDLPCCGIAPGMLVAGDVIDPNHRNVTCPDYVIDLEIGDKVKVCGRVFVVGEVVIHRERPAKISLLSLEEYFQERPKNVKEMES